MQLTKSFKYIKSETYTWYAPLSMFSQRNNPYCELLKTCTAKIDLFHENKCIFCKKMTLRKKFDSDIASMRYAVCS